MRVLKVFYSALSAWERGDKDKAILMMTGGRDDPTDYELYGRKIHEEICDKKWKPFEWMDDSCEYEVKLDVKILPWLKVTGRLDLRHLEKQKILDWKTGISSSTSFKPMQLYVYDLLNYKMTGVKCKEGYLVKVLKFKKLEMEDYSIYKLNDETRQKALDWIEGIASEMYNELI